MTTPLSVQTVDARSPGELGELFATRFANGDLAGLTALFEPGALMPTNYGMATGTDRIREALKGYINSGARLKFTRTIAFEATDVALIHNEWTMQLAGGKEIGGVTAEVARRQPDGTWKYLINSPDGAALLTSPSQQTPRQENPPG
jgi:ketosteroid isomerase-like protein